jgi:mevalonate kinase
VKKTFYSNGKLLLTGEYLVLDGATALAIPTKKGQSLQLESNVTNRLHWNSFDLENQTWFTANFSLPHLELMETNTPAVAKTLVAILQEAQRLNATFLSTSEGFTVTTHLDFPRNWGLGTSSTLINNIAQWAKVDAFVLLQNSFGGSGYDVAAAQHDTPIFYSLENEKPQVKEVNVPWDFTDQIFFVHLNRKQDSKKGIASYKNVTVSKKQRTQISDLTHKLLMCYTLAEFENILQAHERIISEIIQTPTVKERLFPDYPGTIKSLGAWGGDFILATGGASQRNYFKNKGYTTIALFEEMML